MRESNLKKAWKVCLYLPQAPPSPYPPPAVAAPSLSTNLLKSAILADRISVERAISVPGEDISARFYQIPTHHQPHSPHFF